MVVEIIADPGSCWRVAGERYKRSWQRMRELMSGTADAGAQTFKPQFFRADLLYPDGSAEQELVRPYELPEEWLPLLKEKCDERGLELMCTVYHPEHVALVNRYVRRFKVASFESEHVRLRRRLRKTGKPVLVSTGMLDLKRLHRLFVEWSLAASKDDHQSVLWPLHCVSAYPAPPQMMSLAVIRNFNLWPWRWLHDVHQTMGISDHSIGSTAAVMAVAYGASVIEKHIRAADTPASNPDWPHSASPAGFKDYVAAIREAELMLGDGVKRVMAGEETVWRYDPRTGRRGTKGETKP